MAKPEKNFLGNLEFLQSAYLPKQLPTFRQPMVLFLGRSNAGKSSLLNALTNSDLAKVSKNPGKTRSINYYRWGPRLLLVDLPGYGYARRAGTERDQWAELIRHFFDQAKNTMLCFLLVDVKRDLAEEEENLINALLAREASLCLLWTKVDRLSQAERHQRDQAFKNIPFHSQNLSVKSGEGLAEVRRLILAYEKATSH